MEAARANRLWRAAFAKLRPIAEWSGVVLQGPQTPRFEPNTIPFYRHWVHNYWGRSPDSVTAAPRLVEKIEGFSPKDPGHRAVGHLFLWFVREKVCPAEPVSEWYRDLVTVTVAKLVDLREEGAGDWNPQSYFLTLLECLTRCLEAEGKVKTRPCARAGGRPQEGRPTDEQRIYNLWMTGRFPTYKLLGRELSEPAKEVELVVQRVRKREKRDVARRGNQGLSSS